MKFPPLKIHGRKITETKVDVPADISSQFISPSDCRKTGKRTGNKSGWQSDFTVLY
jgi:hypothetical protein